MNSIMGAVCSAAAVSFSELEHNKGTQFDPKLAEAFIELLKEGKIEV